MNSSSSLKESCLERQQRVNSKDTGTVFSVKSSTVSKPNLTSILGYKKKDDERHKDMHSLVGVFIKSDKEE